MPWRLNQSFTSSQRPRVPSSGLAEDLGLEKRSAIITIVFFASRYLVPQAQNLVISLARKLENSYAKKLVRSHTSPLTFSQGSFSKRPALAIGPKLELIGSPACRAGFARKLIRHTRESLRFMKELRFAGKYNKLIVSQLKNAIET